MVAFLSEGRFLWYIATQACKSRYPLRKDRLSLQLAMTLSSSNIQAVERSRTGCRGAGANLLALEAHNRTAAILVAGYLRRVDQCRNRWAAWSGGEDVAAYYAAVDGKQGSNQNHVGIVLTTRLRASTVRTPKRPRRCFVDCETS